MRASQDINNKQVTEEKSQQEIQAAFSTAFMDMNFKFNPRDTDNPRKELNSQVEALQRLIQQGADVNAPLDDGYKTPPLYFAIEQASQGEPGVVELLEARVRLLLSHGANPIQIYDNIKRNANARRLKNCPLSCSALELAKEVSKNNNNLTDSYHLLNHCSEIISRFLSLEVEPGLTENRLSVSSLAHLYGNEQQAGKFAPVVQSYIQSTAKPYYQKAVMQGRPKHAQYFSAIGGLGYQSDDIEKQCALFKELNKLKGDAKLIKQEEALLKNNKAAESKGVSSGEILDQASDKLLKMATQLATNTIQPEDLIRFRQEFANTLREAYAAAGHRHATRTLILTIAACALGVGLLVAGFRLIRGLATDSLHLTAEEVFLGRTATQKAIIGATKQAKRLGLAEGTFFVNPKKAKEDVVDPSSVSLLPNKVR